MPNTKRTKTEARHLGGMITELEDMQVEMALLRRTRDLVPSGWQGLDREVPCTPKKAKMTMRLDADVLEWYRSLGHGYQARMNRVLRAYMHAIISKHIECESGRDWLNLPG